MGSGAVCGSSLDRESSEGFSQRHTPSSGYASIYCDEVGIEFPLINRHGAPQRRH